MKQFEEYFLRSNSVEFERSSRIIPFANDPPRGRHPASNDDLVGGDGTYVYVLAHVRMQLSCNVIGDTDLCGVAL